MRDAVAAANTGAGSESPCNMEIDKDQSQRESYGGATCGRSKCEKEEHVYDREVKTDAKRHRCDAGSLVDVERAVMQRCMCFLRRCDYLVFCGASVYVVYVYMHTCTYFQDVERELLCSDVCAS